MLIFRWEGFCTDEFPLLSMRFRGLCVSLHDYKRSAMLEDFKLKVFVEVAREKSFTRAASALSISQPAVSQNIAELEKQLGTKLLRGAAVRCCLRMPGKCSCLMRKRYWRNIPVPVTFSALFRIRKLGFQFLRKSIRIWSLLPSVLS